LLRIMRDSANYKGDSAEGTAREFVDRKGSARDRAKSCITNSE